VSSVLFALIFVAVAVIVILTAWWQAPGRKHPELAPEMVDVLVELHRVCGRFDVFLFKVEVERHTQHAERELRKELRERL
jgi:hypothetical protein